MVKMILNIEGMACSMCEAHINDIVRKQFPVKKVTSSHSKKITEIIVEQALDEAVLRKTIGNTGYTVTDIQIEPYEEKKKRFSFFNK